MDLTNFRFFCPSIARILSKLGTLIPRGCTGFVPTAKVNKSQQKSVISLGQQKSQQKSVIFDQGQQISHNQ